MIRLFAFGFLILSATSVHAAPFLFGFTGETPQFLEITTPSGPSLYSTGTSPFTGGIQNQGWWGAIATNDDANDNYCVGECDGDGTRNNFFTFDLSGLTELVLSATLILGNGMGSGVLGPDPVVDVTYSLFDVSTDPVTLNFNNDASPAIFADLGSGVNYGTYSVSTGLSGGTSSFLLNGAAIADLNAARGDFFSIGGTLSEPAPIPEPGTLFLFGLGLAVAAARRRLH